MEPNRHRARVLLALAAAALLPLAAANAGLAFVFPLELELREGTSWLHVLASRAGLSLYDHSQVAFLNMNHGPLDPWLKAVISRLAPFLSAAMVTRFFIPLLPVGLFLAVRGTGRGKLEAMVWALGLYLFLLGLQPPNFLIGRSDPAALFELSLLLWLTPAAIRKNGAAHSPALRPTFALGAMGAVVILTNWRFFPAVGAVLAGAAMESVLLSSPDRRPPLFGRFSGGLALGAGLVSAVVFFGLFRGNGSLYYQHFFGFFSTDSGWGALQDEPFQLFPRALLTSRWLIHLLAAGVLILGFVHPSAELPRRTQTLVSLPLLALLWVSSAAAYFFNHSGGGVYYFAPFYVLLVHHLVRAVAWSDLKIPGMREGLLAGLFFTLPWPAVWQQAKRLENSFGPAFAFLAETKRLTAGATVRSEDFYFFKDRYDGEAVDMGDVVFKVKSTGYFGAEFGRTADRYFERLATEPPRFVVTGGLGSPPLQALLAKSYRPILRVPADPATYPGPAQTLYRLQSPPE